MPVKNDFDLCLRKNANLSCKLVKKLKVHKLVNFFDNLSVKKKKKMNGILENNFISSVNITL